MANPHPKTDHLPKIQKGEVRNPSGRNRKMRLTDALMKILDGKKYDPEHPTFKLVKAAYDTACIVNAAGYADRKHIWDRLEGAIPKAEPDTDETLIASVHTAMEIIRAASIAQQPRLALGVDPGSDAPEPDPVQ